MSWGKVEIGSLVTLRQGFAINKNTKHHMSDEVTALPLLRIADMKAGARNVFVKDTIPLNFIAQSDDIIYTRTGQVGLVFTNQSGVVHNNCFTVSPNDEQVLCRPYLYYALQTKEFYETANSKATGAAQPDLPHGAFNTIPIFLPPIEAQHRIANILSAYDSLIENSQKQIKLLEEAAQRLYKEWFIDLRFPGYETIPIVDGVPEGWKEKSLSDIADVVMGQSPKSEFYNQNREGLPFHQGVGSYGPYFVVDGTYSTSFTRIAEAGSILFSVRAPVGRLNITKNKIVIGRGIAAVNHKKGYQSFLFYLLKERFFKDNLVGNGSIFASISKDELLGQKFLIPDDLLTKKYNGVAREFDQKIAVLDEQINLLTQARNRLLPKLMSGELEV